MKIANIAIKGVEASGGIEKYALELGSRLVARGHEVVVYSMNRYKPVYTEYKGVTIKPLPRSSGEESRKTLRNLHGLHGPVDQGQERHYPLSRLRAIHPLFHTEDEGKEDPAAGARAGNGCGQSGARAAGCSSS